jgi:hypothetical protein
MAWARAGLSLALLVFIGFFGAHADAVILRVGPGETYPMPSAAAAVAKNGDRVEIDPGRYVDCAVWTAGNLLIEGDAPGVVIADRSCAGKGLIVLDGDGATIRNLTLEGARVSDKNGAGIRLESGNLVVDGVTFIDDEMGVLGGFPGATVTIRNSTFYRDGRLGRMWGHAVYIFYADRARIEDSRFFETRQGHSIKSRAARTEVIGCAVADGPAGTSSFLIDAPNGGSLIVSRNTLEKGPNSDNYRVAMAIGEEGVKHPTPQITIADNSFRNDNRFPTVFLWNRTSTPAVLQRNKFAGPVIVLDGLGRGTAAATAAQIGGMVGGAGP